MCCMINCSLAQVDGLLQREVIGVTTIEDTVGVSGTRANGESLALESVPIVIDIVQVRASLVPTGNHGPAGQTSSSVGVEDVGKNLGGSSHRDAVLVAELMHPAGLGEVSFPEGAICCTTGHG